MRHFHRVTCLLTIACLTSVASAEMHLQWVRELPQRDGAWQHVQRISSDSAYQPVAGGELVFIGCEHNGALIACDARTGEERWRYFTNGPIRNPPAADARHVYLASDDGHLYCLDHSGRLVWKRRGGPTDRTVIGHGRLVSPWVASTAPLLSDDGSRLYCTFGYWPLDGVYVHAIDPATGQVIWTNGSVEFRPFGKPILGDDGHLHILGHNGGATFDVTTGKTVDVKTAKPGPGPAFPDVKGVEGQVRHRIVSNGLALVTTNESRVYCFAERPGEGMVHEQTPTPDDGGDASTAKRLIEQTRVRDGYCLVAGLRDGSLVEGLLAESALHVVAVDTDRERVDRIRALLDARGRFDDHRLTVLHGDPATLGMPPYFASLITSEGDGAIDERWHESLRPYGGVLARRDGDKLTLTRREGALPDSGQWTHGFHDAANTLASAEARVKAPLGVLWYGGAAGDARFYFDGHVDHQSGHGINAQPVGAQVVDGRMILQGPALLGAIDIYTGRVLWETPLPQTYVFGGPGGGLGIHSKKHPQPWAHEEANKAEVKPTEHSRASGFNMVSLSDGIYVAAGPHCIRIDPVTGKEMSRWRVPLADTEKDNLCWGSLRADGDLLVATVLRPRDLIDAQAGYDGQGGDYGGDRMPMAHLLVIDRHSGKPLWSRRADWGFINRSGVAVGGGKVYCVDLVEDGVLKKWREAGRELPDSPPVLYALDLKTGEIAWRFTMDVLARNIVYAADRDMLILPCRNLIEWENGTWANRAVDVRRGKTNKNAPGRMRAFRGADGTLLWQVEEAPYHAPHIVLGDLIIDRHGYTYDLATGKRNMRTDPVTGSEQAWNFRKGGCNHLVACQTLVTWRTAFYDLATGSGAMKLTGLDAGCTPTLIPAGGVLNIPNFGTHHKRNRMAAMTLVHRPDNALWTIYAESLPDEPAPVRQIGYNFGAPGDRVTDDGVWVTVTSRKQENVRVEPKKEVDWYQWHTAQTGSLVASSGVIGAASIEAPTVRVNKLSKNDKTVRRYRVRLHFAEPEATAEGQRVFSVSLEGRQVITDLDIFKEAGGANKPLVREFALDIEGVLNVTLTAKAGRTLLSGIELTADAAKPTVRAPAAATGMLTRAVTAAAINGKSDSPIADAGEVKPIKTDMKKADTPAWLADQGVLVFTDLELGKVYTADASGDVKEIREGAARAKLGPDGRLYGVIDNKLASWKPGEEPKVIAEKAAGGREFSLNDLAVTRGGKLYFSTLKDPEKGRLSVVDIASGQVTVLFDGEQESGLWNPNGVALSPDEKHLYVGISSYKNRKTSAVYRFAIKDDGTIDIDAGKASKWADVKAPDGIAVDTAGNVYFNAGNKVPVYSPDGKKLGNLKLPKGAKSGTNLCFGGPDGRTLYITTWNGLYAVHLDGK